MFIINSVFTNVFTLGVVYLQSYNASIVFAPFGFIFLASKNYFGKIQFSLIITSVLSLFLILSVDYFIAFFSPILALLSAFGIIHMIDTRKSSPLLSKGIFFLFIFSNTFYLIYQYGNEYFIGFYSLSFFSITALFLSQYRKFNSIFVIIFICLTSSVTYSQTAHWADDEQTLLKQNEGPIYLTETQTSSSIWFKTFGDAPYLCPEAGVRNQLSSISGIQSLTSYYEISDQELFIDSFEAEFDLFLFWETKRDFYEVKIVAQHDLLSLDTLIVRDNNPVIISLYNPKYFVYSSELFSTPEYEQSEYLEDTKENTYKLYVDSKVSINRVES